MCERVMKLLVRVFHDVPEDMFQLAIKLGLVIPAEAAVVLACKFIGVRTYEPSIDDFACAWNMTVEDVVNMELAALDTINWNIAQFLTLGQ